jgi:hypothetical protein
VPKPKPPQKVAKLTQTPTFMKENTWVNLSFFLIVSLLTSCQNEKCGKTHDLKDYYFPLPKTNSPLIYQYSSKKDTLLTKIFWRLERGKDNTIHFLQFDERWEPQQIAQEKLLPDGVIQEKIFFSQKDTLTGTLYFTKPRILYDNVFPFCANAKGGIYLYAIEWEEADKPEFQYTLYRNRRFWGDTILPIKPFEGEKLYYFIAKDLVDIHLKNQGYTQPEMTTKEFYQKGIGLVKYTKYVGEEQIMEYQLDTIYSAASFYKQKGINFEKWEQLIHSLLH